MKDNLMNNGDKMLFIPEKRAKASIERILAEREERKTKEFEKMKREYEESQKKEI